MPRTTKVRISAALSTTQLLPLIHILRNQPREDCRDVLLWFSYAGTEENRHLMSEVIKAYEFSAAFELADLECLRPRRAGPLLWPLQTMLRHRRDATRIKRLLAPHLAGASAVEVWTDEPIHFPMRFLHGLFPKAVHVRFPHCFDHDNASSVAYRQRMIANLSAEASWARRLFWQAIHLSSGVRYNLQYGIQFDRAYTFGERSPWAKQSVDVSCLIEAQAMNATYAQLPPRLRQEVEEKIRQAWPAPRRPWALLLLFGLNADARREYRNAICRIHRERPESLADLQLVLKPHPTNRNDQPETLARELSQALDKPVTLFDCTLNLDILWSVVPARLVLAGPCGALPTIKRLGMARAVVLREILDQYMPFVPEQKAAFEAFVEDYEVW